MDIRTDPPPLEGGRERGRKREREHRADEVNRSVYCRNRVVHGLKRMGTRPKEYRQSNSAPARGNLTTQRRQERTKKLILGGSS
jgi:hypothetical protein